MFLALHGGAADRNYLHHVYFDGVSAYLLCEINKNYMYRDLLKSNKNNQCYIESMFEIQLITCKLLPFKNF